MMQYNLTSNVILKIGIYNTLLSYNAFESLAVERKMQRIKHAPQLIVPSLEEARYYPVTSVNHHFRSY